VLEVPFAKLDPEVETPRRATRGDAGLDLAARHPTTIAPGGGRALVPTGLAVAIPEGFAGLIMPRSGLALRHGVTVLNAPGLIDSGYRGELSVLLCNTDPVSTFEVRRGDRIAQLVVQRVELATLVPVDDLGASERGFQGWGHSGVSTT